MPKAERVVLFTGVRVTNEEAAGDLWAWVTRRPFGMSVSACIAKEWRLGRPPSVHTIGYVTKTTMHVDLPEYRIIDARFLYQPDGFPFPTYPVGKKSFEPVSS
jgi:hypothetical protein